ncbi:MAG: glucuronate isomerase, partial [Rikenellaceae bacterium]
HGLDTFYADNYTESDLMQIFAKVRSGQTPSPKEISQYRSGVLFDLAAMDSEKDWTQQFHIGVIRNNNSRMFKKIGADTGFDSIHDLPCSVAGNKYFDRLTEANKLAKTILYNLNPKDNEVLATMAYNFNDGSVAGKMQLGSGWWFLDQEDGMRKQINALSALGLLSRFVGMLTDSRSFLSYPRHEYFRRILCNIIGQDVVNGKLPKSEMEFIGKMVEDISYYNAKNYFDF